MIELFPDQQVALEDVRDCFRRRVERILLVAPCGWGKGTVAGYIIERMNQRGKRALFLVNRREIVKDFSRRLDRIGIDHGIIMADHPRRKPHLGVHVVSIDTLHRRESVPPADLLVVDEGHFATSRMWQETFARYAGVPVLGMTATPLGPGGTALKGTYHEMVLGPTTAELIELGRLVPIRPFIARERPDTSGVRAANTDSGVNDSDAARALDKPRLIGNIVEHWLQIASGRPSVCFAAGVEHSKHITDEFIKAGVRCVHVDAKTPSEVRDAVWEDLAKFKVQICSNVGVTSYGWDVPQVSCVIAARITTMVTIERQMLGRGQRTAPGKVDCLWLDHANWFQQFGFIEDDPEWSLEGERKKRRLTDRAPSVRQCGSCWAGFRSGLTTCPYCGWECVSEVELPRVADGILEEVTNKKQQPKPYKVGRLSGNPVLAHFQLIAERKQYSHKWFWAQFELFKKGKVRVPPDVHEEYLAYLAKKEQVA